MFGFYLLSALAFVLAATSVVLMLIRIRTMKRPLRGRRYPGFLRGIISEFSISSFAIVFTAICLLGSFSLMKLARDSVERETATRHWQRMVQLLHIADGNFGVAHYRALELGRTSSEVIGFLGGDYEELRRSSNDNVGELVLRWRRRDGASITATFRDGKLVEKAQDGL